MRSLEIEESRVLRIIPLPLHPGKRQTGRATQGEGIQQENSVRRYSLFGSGMEDERKITEYSEDPDLTVWRPEQG